MRAAACIFTAFAAWLTFVWLLRPRRPRVEPRWPHPPTQRRFPAGTPVSLGDLADGDPLDDEELWEWRGIVAGLRDWQRDGAS